MQCRLDSSLTSKAGLDREAAGRAGESKRGATAGVADRVEMLEISSIQGRPPMWKTYNCVDLRILRT
jgi:hypothetical protein